MQHLLVVDDDAAVALVMQMALEAGGAARVTTARDATEALAVIGRDFPSAAIIDAVLPRTPGWCSRGRSLISDCPFSS